METEKFPQQPEGVDSLPLCACTDGICDYDPSNREVERCRLLCHPPPTPPGEPAPNN